MQLYGIASVGVNRRNHISEFLSLLHHTLVGDESSEVKLSLIDAKLTKRIR